VRSTLHQPPSALSFAFPGPADYEKGIIGNLVNLPLFKGGVALGPMLKEKFGVPVFINNDGDLFTLGEAKAGFLPELNDLLEKSGNSKRYLNLLGGTLGTGFGGGIVINGVLLTGDNSAQAEINRMRNRINTNFNTEESVSVRGAQRVYVREACIEKSKVPSVEDIFKIGMGLLPGNKKAAIAAFEELAVAAGDSLANAATLIDAPIVLGGGISGAHPLFLRRLVDEMNTAFQTHSGKKVNRLEVKVYNLEDKNELAEFLKGGKHMIQIPFSDRKVAYDPSPRIGVGITKLGTSKAVSIGAYNYALNRLDHF